MNTLTDTLYNAWIVGTKDILDALRHKSSMTNILMLIGMTVFFYWFGTLRPFDKDVSVVVYDEGNTSLTLESATLKDGAIYSFRDASSLPEMERKMSHQNLGLVLPANFNQTLNSTNTITLTGYIFWADRMKVPELEAKYSQAFTEILDHPVQVVIGRNIVIPQAGVNGMQATVAAQMMFFVFFASLFLIPHLMMEEKQTRTLDALLTSPASTGQVVLGKALAGFFYVLIIGGLYFALNWAYIVHWGLALAAFLGYAMLAVGLGLLVGSFIKSVKQLTLWILPLILIMEIPPLFYMEENLKAGIRSLLNWFPSSALASLFRFSCSTGATSTQVLSNLAIAFVSIVAVFGLVIWKVQRSDRETHY